MSNKLLDLIFKEGEGICVGDFYSTKVSIKPTITETTEFYCINPLNANIDLDFELKETYKQDVPRRADRNVSAFRNFIFEMDSVPLDTQFAILDASGLPFTGIVYSGGKSYHAILALEEALDLKCHTDSGIQAYKTIWKRLAAKINLAASKLGHNFNVVDQSCKNPSRLTRMPFSVRSNGNIQTLVKLGSLVPLNAFKEILELCPKVFTPVISNNYEVVENFDISTPEAFFSLAPRGLALMIKYPDWISTEGNYPTMLRIALWAIDSCNIPKSLLVEVCEQYIFQGFRKVGYPKQKWLNGIDHAYKLKNRN